MYNEVRGNNVRVRWPIGKVLQDYRNREDRYRDKCWQGTVLNVSFRGNTLGGRAGCLIQFYHRQIDIKSLLLQEIICSGLPRRRKATTKVESTIQMSKLDPEQTNGLLFFFPPSVFMIGATSFREPRPARIICTTGAVPLRPASPLFHTEISCLRISNFRVRRGSSPKGCDAQRIKVRSFVWRYASARTRAPSVHFPRGWECKYLEVGLPRYAPDLSMVSQSRVIGIHPWDLF